MKTLEATAKTSAPPSAVWALLADGPAWADWGSWSQATVEDGGRELRPGVVRVLVARPFTVRERITEMVPEERLGYEMLDGMKIQGYSSQITLEPSDGGTLVRWRSQWEKGNPVHALILRIAIRDACRRVAKAAAR